MSEIETTHDVLLALINRVEYRPGWRVAMAEEDGVKLLHIYAKGFDSYHPERGETYRVLHSFQIPPATYNEQSWTRWLLDRYIDVETHEACEFFKVTAASGTWAHRPFAPNHGPGWNPYGVRELNRVEDAETTFRGERREGTQGFDPFALEDDCDVDD